MRLQLAAATTALVIGGSAGAAAAQSDGTEVGSDVLVYTDTDNVVVVSPQVGARHALDEDGGEVSARYVLDAISAASADVVSSATYRFSELRNEVDLGVSKSIGEWLPSVSYRYSHEPDYQSHGFTLGSTRSLADGDTTVGASLGLVRDSVGRTGTPSPVFSESLTIGAFEASLTQTLDQQTLMRAVYSLSGQSGYMEKPYRSVPLFDAAGLAAAEAMGGLDASNYESFRVGARPLEEVPDTRFRHAFAVRGLRFIEPIGASLRLDYRFYFDSWGMTAHTAEPALSKAFGESFQLSVWSRFHWQSSADFWQRAYVVNAGEIPSLRSTDRSLSKSWHLTGGARTEIGSGALTGYLELSALYSAFPEFLFLDARTALIGQAGIRWRF